jgi:type II secretory pathway component PulF
MPAFAYQALDTTGKTQRGVLQGDTARAVRGVLRERGLNPLSVDEVREGAAGGSGFARRGLGAAQLALLTRQLATCSARACRSMKRSVRCRSKPTANASARSPLPCAHA